jgi:hypothetical protein
MEEEGKNKLSTFASEWYFQDAWNLRCSRVRAVCVKYKDRSSLKKELH